MSKQLYKEFVQERLIKYGAKRVKKEKTVRKRHFFRKKERIQSLIIEAKKLKKDRKETEAYVRHHINNDDDHIYGSFTIMIIEAIVSFLIKRLLNRYFS